MYCLQKQRTIVNTQSSVYENHWWWKFSVFDLFVIRCARSLGLPTLEIRLGSYYAEWSSTDINLPVITVRECNIGDKCVQPQSEIFRRKKNLVLLYLLTGLNSKSLKLYSLENFFTINMKNNEMSSFHNFNR